ncbi:MAG: hypothetical protein BWZ00_01720 [Bacteroidetes bacterium ADurb.BinA174]|nr:MAG: hypothetical protein BWZ00_01720 [Bacteroidetes bacterium ADurb.BinA174]
MYADRKFLIDLINLWQITDIDAAYLFLGIEKSDITRYRLYQSQNCFQQCGLSATVWPDNAQKIVFENGKRNVF